MARFEYVALPETMGEYELVHPAPVVKTDPAVAFVDSSPEGLFRFQLPVYDPATANPVNAIHVVLVPDGQAVPDTAAEAVVSSFPHFVTSTVGNVAGGVIPVDAGTASPGKYAALAIVEFES